MTTRMPTITVTVPNVEWEFTIDCGECGETLRVDVADATSFRATALTVIPCEACLEDARKSGRKEAD